MAKKKVPEVVDDPATLEVDESVELANDDEIPEVVGGPDPATQIVVDGVITDAPLDTSGQPILKQAQLIIGGRNVEHTHEESGVWAYRSM